MNKGKQYKDINKDLFKTIAHVRNSQEFKATWGSIFAIKSPYIQVALASEKVTKKYLDVTEDNVIKELKDSGINDLNTLTCLTEIGGDDSDFTKNLHMVLKVYDKDGKVKALQPKEIYTDEYKSDTTQFFPYSPVYSNSFIGIFDYNNIISLNPVQLGIVVIYPNGREISEKFDFNKLNNI